MCDRGDEQSDVGVVDAGDSVVEADEGACGEAGRQLKDTPFAAGAGEVPDGEGSDGGVPVDGGHRRAVAGAVVDEPAGEVVAVQEGAVPDEQFGAGFEREQAGGAGAEGRGQVVSVHGGLRW